VPNQVLRSLYHVAARGGKAVQENQRRALSSDLTLELDAARARDLA
jgi:hypothetical protein